MELIAAILLAGPLGYFVKRGLLAYLAVWAVIFPLQTVIVYADTDPAGNDALYWVFNAVILAFGVGLNRLGHRLRVGRGKDQGALVMRREPEAKTIES